MTAFCALLPLATVFVSLSFGGGTTPFVLLQTVLLLPLVNRCRAIVCRVAVPLLLLSVVLRFSSLFFVSKGALSSVGAIFFAVICLAASCIAAVRSDTALRFANPLLFLAIVFAIFTAVVSFPSALRIGLGDASVIEIVSSFVCPISSCLALTSVAELQRLKRFYALTGGLLICAAFVIFESSGALFAFLSVPLAILVSSVEIKALLKGIKGIERE